MPTHSQHEILLVDDEPSIRETLSLLLTSSGYKVFTAKDGFDALLQIRNRLPDVIVSDLNMPQMSGFELLSVIRRRFPQMLVIAMSGAYNNGEAVPGGIIADAFYAKGLMHPQELLKILTGILHGAASRTDSDRKLSAPVWVPRNGNDSNGIPYIVLTCTDCLRSFPLNVVSDFNPEIVETSCIFCRSRVRYIIDFSLSVASPAKMAAAKTENKTGAA